MQNRAIRTPLSVSYDSFQEIFRARPDRLYWFTHCPHLRPIQDLHHHDAVEVGYCSSGAGIFLIERGRLLFFRPLCHRAVSRAASQGTQSGRTAQSMDVHHFPGGSRSPSPSGPFLRTSRLALLPGREASAGNRSWCDWQKRRQRSWKGAGREARSAPGRCWPPSSSATDD